MCGCRRANDPGLLERGASDAEPGSHGFASVDAGEDEGTLTTTPERLGGVRLFVNARTTGRSGAIAVDVLPREGGAARGVLATGAFRGDALRRLPPGEYRLRFRIRSGSLYSYRLPAGG